MNKTVGISGCSLRVDGDRIIKSSNVRSYDQRLILQAKKQYLFAKNEKISNFKSPFVFNVGGDFFSMERINGLSYYDFFMRASIDQIDSAAEKLISFINAYKSRSVFYPQKELSSLIGAKLSSLYDKSSHKNLIDDLIRELPAIDAIPKSFCHGDFTLSNMIFLDDDIYLIDFLDSFIDSYWVDLIKLKQDLYYLWCLSFLDGGDCVRLRLVFDNLYGKIKSAFREDFQNPAFNLLDKVSILRIEPYLPLDKAFILQKMLHE